VQVQPPLGGARILSKVAQAAGLTSRFYTHYASKQNVTFAEERTPKFSGGGVTIPLHPFDTLNLNITPRL